MEKDKKVTEEQLREFCLQYTIQQLELQRTKINCINLGWSREKPDFACELSLIDHSIKYLKKGFKE